MIKQLGRVNPARWAQSLVDYVFGYDFFISYKHTDGRSYPRQLSERLTGEGFRVFFDERGYVPGDELVQATRRQVRKSSYLLIIARPGAVTNSEWVIRETQVSIEAGKTPIVLDVNKAFLTATVATEDEASRANTLRSLLQHRLRIEEVAPVKDGEVYDGQPSQQVILELKRSFAAKRQDSRRARAFGLAAVVFAALSVAAGLLAWQSYTARRQAEREARRARAGELAAQSRLARSRQPQLAALLASEAVYTASLSDEQDVISTDQALMESVTGLTGHGLSGHSDEVLTAAFSPDNEWLATGSRDDTTRLWNLARVNSDSKAIVLAGSGAEDVSSLAFSPDSRWLLTAGDDGSASLWRLGDTENISSRTLVATSAESVLRSFVFSNDARWLAAVTDDNEVWTWDLTIPDPTSSPKRIGEGLYTARHLRFSSDGRWLVGFGITTNDLWLWDDFSKIGAITGPRVLRGHSSPVSFATISAQKNLLASADDNGNVILWDLESFGGRRTPLVSVKGRPKSIWSLSFSYDGTWLAAAQGNSYPSNEDVKANNVLLWNISGTSSGVEGPVLLEHDVQIRSIAFDPTNRWLYVEGHNGPVRLWALGANPAPAPLILNGHATGVKSHDFSTDGRYLVTADNNGGANLWDLSCPETKTTPIPLPGHEGGINDIDISSDGRWIATAGYDWTVRLWDLSLPYPGDSLVLKRNCVSDITEIALSDNERWLAGGTNDGQVSLWDLTAEEPARTVTVLRAGAAENKVEQLVFSPDNRWLAAVTQNSGLDVWNLTVSQVAQTRRAFHENEKVAPRLISIAFSSDGRKLASADFDGGAWLWDLEEQHPASTRRALSGEGRKIQDVWISPDGRWLVGGAYDELWIWNLASGGAELTPRQLTKHDSNIRFVRFSPDSRWLISIDNYGKARMWRTTSAGIAPGPEFTADDRSIDKVAFRPDSQGFVSTGSGANQPRLWTINPDGKTVTYSMPPGTIEATSTALVSPNNKWLVCNSPSTLQLWPLGQTEKLSWIVATSDSIVGMAFSRDGQHLAYGGDSGSISIIRLGNSRQPSPVRLSGHLGGARGLAFSAGGRWMVSQSYNAIRLWPLRREELLTLAEFRTGRNLSPTEWSAYFSEEAYRKTFQRLPVSAYLQ